MTQITLARNAMATRFEMVLAGEDPVLLRAAGEEALAEAERLERHLSLYQPTSAISLLNARAGRERVRVDAEVFRLLEVARTLSFETGGAFDVTVAPLVQCWGFMGGSGAMPPPRALEEARQKVGCALLDLDPADFSIRFGREGAMLDLGAIGKGYAVDQMAAILEEAGVRSALVHGGTSTIYAFGHGPGGQSWKVAIERPRGTSEPAQTQPLAVVQLERNSLSVSADSGKFFIHEGKRYGHVIDPRTGFPVERARLAAVMLPSCLESDALSTALLILGREGLDLVQKIRPQARALLAWEEGSQLKIEMRGME